MMKYTGIGARSTPPDILATMTKLAQKLSGLGYHLLSGGATGADQAFQNGAKDATIWLPWRDFELGNQLKHPGHTYHVIQPSDKDAFESVKSHPRYPFKDSIVRLMARNYRQIYSDDGNHSKFVIFWTPEIEPSGGTAFAYDLAISGGIPTFNLRNPYDLARIERFLNKV